MRKTGLSNLLPPREIKFLLAKPNHAFGNGR